MVHERVEPDQRIEIGSEDACRLAANAVCVGNALVMSGCGDRLRAELNERGYRVIAVPLPSFLRSGAASSSLMLPLDLRSPTAAALPRQRPVPKYPCAFAFGPTLVLRSPPFPRARG